MSMAIVLSDVFVFEIPMRGRKFVSESGTLLYAMPSKLVASHQVYIRWACVFFFAGRWGFI